MKRRLWILAVMILTVLLFSTAAADGTTGEAMVLPEEESISVIQDVYLNGQSITISFDQGENIAKYSIVVKDIDGSNGILWKPVYTFEIPSTSLEENARVTFNIPENTLTCEAVERLYSVDLWAYDAAGKAEGFLFHVFAVIPNASPEKRISIYTTDINNKTDNNDNNLETSIGQNNFFVVADAPGAKCVWITVNGETVQGKAGESHMCANFGFEKTGTYEYYATALYENQNGTSYTRKTEPKAVVATAIPDDNNSKLNPSITWGTSGMPEGSWTAGNDIEFTIGQVSNTIGDNENVWYVYSLYDITDDEETIAGEYRKQHDAGTPESIEKLLGTSKTVTIDGDLLTVGHQYQVWINVTSRGKEAFQLERFFTVVPVVTAEDVVHPAPTLKMLNVTANGESWTVPEATVTAPLRKTQKFRIELAEGQAKPKIVRYWNNTYFEYRDWNENETQMTFEVDFWWAAEHAVFAQLYYGDVPEDADWERDLAWKEPVSNIIHVNVTVDGTRATPAEFALVNAAGQALSDDDISALIIKQGDYLRVKLKNTVDPDDYEYLYASLVDGDDRNYGWVFQNSDDIYALPTAMLKPGYYTLRMTAAQAGKNDAYTDFYFRVAPKDGADEDTIFFTVDKTSVISYDPFNVAFYAPEKEGYDKHYIFFDGVDERTDEQWDGEGFGALECDLDPGNWDLWAKVVYTKEGAPDIEVTSTPVHMQASTNGDYGLNLIAPEVIVKDEDTQEIEFTIQGLDETAKALIGRNWWEVRINGDFEDGEYFYANSEFANLESSYSFPIDDFRVGENYKIYVHYNIKGYNSYETEVSFCVVEAVSDTVTLGINGIEPVNGVYALTTNVNEEFVVSWGSNQKPKAIRFHHNQGWEYREDYDWEDESYDQSYSFDYGFVSGDQSVYAQVAYEWDENGKDWIWTGVTNSLKLSVTGKGDAPKPVLKFVKTDETGAEVLDDTITINRGDLLKVQIVSASGPDGNNETITSTHFHGYIRDRYYGFQHAEIDLETKKLPAYLTFPTASLEEGEYYVEVDGCLEKYDWNGTWIKFNVIEPSYEAGNEPFILNIQEPVYANTPFSISAYEPNASRIEIVIHNKADGEDTSHDAIKDWFEGNAADDHDERVDRGTYEIYAIAYYENGKNPRTREKKEIEAGYKTPGLLKPVIAVEAPVFTKDTESESLIFTVSNLEQDESDYSDVSIYDVSDGKVRINPTKGGNGTFTVDTDDLVVSHAYCIEAKVGGPGYEEQRDEATVIVVSGEEEGDAPTLLINGSDAESVNWTIGKEFSMRVIAPSTATAVRAMTENGWQYWSGNINDNEYNSIWSEGTYTFIAQACYVTDPEIIPWAAEDFDWDEWNARNGWSDFDWDEITAWSPVSNSISVTFAGNGTLEAPALTLTYPHEGEPKRGDTLIANVGSVKNAEKYQVTVKRLNEEGDPDDGDDDYCTEAAEAGNFAIPTGHLQAGQAYGVWASVNAEGYGGNDSVLKTFILNESEEAIPGRLEISKTEVTTGEDITIYAYAPDVAEGEQIVVVIRKVSENGWRNDRYSDKQGDFWRWSVSEAGIYSFTLYIRSWDKDNQEHLTRVEGVEPKTLTVTAESSIGELVLTGIDGVISSSINTPIIASYGIKGTNNTITTKGVDEFDIELDYTPETGDGYRALEYSRRSFEADAGRLTLTADDLKEDGAYRLTINAKAKGKTDSELVYKFLVTSAAVDDSISLKVNGGTSDIYDWKNDSFIHVEAEAPNATAIRIMDDGNWQYYTGNSVDETEWSYEHKGDYTLVAQISTTDDPEKAPWTAEGFDWKDHPDFWDHFDWRDCELEWSGISSSITVHVVTEDQLATPTIAINGESSSIALGDLLPVTIEGVEHAEEYYVSVDEIDENGYETENHENGFGFNTYCAGDAVIPTIGLEAGHRYGVKVMCKAAGYENSFTSEYAYFTVTANEELEDGFFSIYPTETDVNKNFAISIYAPGARNIRFCHNTFDNDWATTEGDTLADARAISTVDSFTFLAFAEYGDDNGSEWRLVGEPITVTASEITAAAAIEADIDLSEAVYTETSTGNQTINFALKIKAGQMRYHHSVELCRADDMSQTAELKLGSFGPISGGTYDYEYNYSTALKDLPAGNYCIRAKVNPKAVGQEEIEIMKEFLILEADATVAGNLTINGEAGSVSVEKQSDMNVQVSAGENKEITAFRIYVGDDRWENRGGDSDSSLRIWNDGVYPVYAQYTTEEIDWSQFDHENGWANIQWEGYTNVVMVTVTSREKLSMPTISINPSNGHVKRGESIIITIGAETDTGDVWYGASMQNVMTEDNTPYTGWDNNSRKITIPTASLSPGTYTVSINKDGTGYKQINCNTIMVVDEAKAGEVLVYIEKTEVLTQEDVQWEVYAPGAVSIVVKGYSSEHKEGEFFFENDNSDWEGDKTIIGGMSCFGGHEGTAYIKATATYQNGTTKTAGPVEINVIAPYGDLKPHTIRGGLYYADNETINFTIEPDQHTEWYKIDTIWLHDKKTGTGESFYETPEGMDEHGNRSWTINNNPDNAVHVRVAVYQAAKGYNDISAQVWLRPITTTGLITLPNMLTTIEDEAFADNPAITHVIVPNQVTSIGEGAFSNCEKLWTIEIPSTVTSIGEGAFSQGNITIYGHGGSEAETYAKKEHIDFINIDPINNQD